MAQVKTKKGGQAAKVTHKVAMKSGGKADTPLSTVRFGSVVVSASPPRQVELRRNVNRGRQALARAASNIVKAGVSLPIVDSVPLYRADPQNPEQLIRDLNGKISTGVFVAGKFKSANKR